MLSRKQSEAVVIGKDITVTVVDIQQGRVRLGITAPDDVEIDRLEVRERKELELGGES